MAAWLQAQRPEVQWWCPQLPPSPRAALDLLMAGIAAWPDGSAAVMGSSLGGFYATVVAEARGWPAVLLNPAVDPARDLARHIGALTAWHEPAETFYFHPAYVDALAAMRPAVLTRPERYFAVIAKGDEVLDWREMAARHAGARIRLLEGGDHALSDFDTHLPAILEFLHLCD